MATCPYCDEPLEERCETCKGPACSCGYCPRCEDDIAEDDDVTIEETDDDE